MSTADLRARISTEARGTPAHALIVDYLVAKRASLFADLSRTPDDQLVSLKARIIQIEEIIADLTRSVDAKRPVKPGPYTC